jgi:hypothetical protein
MILGFEKVPKGSILTQLLDLQSDVGVAYERSVGFYKEPHIHDRHIVVFPRGATKIRVETFVKGSLSEEILKDTFLLDSSSFLIIPPGLKHNDLSTSVIYDTLALFPCEEFLKDCMFHLQTDSLFFDILFSEGIHLQKSPWLDALIQCYFIETLLNENKTKRSVYFLEKQIFSELVFLVKSRSNNLNLGKLSENIQNFDSNKLQCDKDSSFYTRHILQYIESRLFENISITEIKNYV